MKCYTSTNVARESDITGNVEFLPLAEGEESWARKIYGMDHARDEKATKKIPDKFRIEETVTLLEKIYNKSSDEVK